MQHTLRLIFSAKAKGSYYSFGIMLLIAAFCCLSPFSSAQAGEITTPAAPGHFGGEAGHPLLESALSDPIYLNNLAAVAAGAECGPEDIDSDGDGILDSLDIDNDNDGILDLNEGFSLAGGGEASYFPNPDFEEYFRLPDEDQLLFYLVNWFEATLSSADFYHADGWMGGTDLDPFAIAPPTPSGSGFVGTLDATASDNTVEYIANILNTPLQAGVSYQFDLLLGALSEEPTTAIYKGGYSGQFVIYGRENTASLDFPFLTQNVLSEQPGWVEIDRIEIDISANSWQPLSLTFTADAPYNAIAIGGEDGTTPSVLLYDNLSLSETAGSAQDSDGDGIFDACDLDSDNDGISDLVESGAESTVLAADSDRSGSVSLAEAGAANGGTADADGDGLMDLFDQDTTLLRTGDPATSVGTVPANSDNQDVADFLDLDSDNDGIPDAVEAQPTANYATDFTTDGDVSDEDSDGDGVIDLYDNNGSFGGSFTGPADSDEDGQADFLDLDSDNDGKPDVTEHGLVTPANPSYADPNGTLNDPQTGLANEIGDTNEVAYREGEDVGGPSTGTGVAECGPLDIDTDGDGFVDSIDLDNDNDGILDINEGTSTSTGDITSLFPNPDFEEYSAIPTEVTQMDLLDGWYQATLATTDFYHNRGFLGPVGESGRAPRTPSGQGFVGSVDWTPYPWIEYVGNVLLEPMEAGTNYQFELLVGTPASNRGPIGYDGEFVIYGHPNVVNFPVQTYGKLAGARWVELYREEIEIPSDSWQTQTVQFVADQNYRSIVFGGENARNISVILFDRLELSVATSADTDGDGIFDACDLDSDNDGISDLVESGAAQASADSDNSGTVSVTEAAAANGGVPDADRDGLADIFDADSGSADPGRSAGIDPVNSDGRDEADYHDLDSDNDGIPDAVEAQLTASYATDFATDGNVTDDDADGDGVIGIYDGRSGSFGGRFNRPVDTEGDGTPDYLDADSENDGKPDRDEHGLANSGGPAGQSYADPNGRINDPQADLLNESLDTSEVAYREAAITQPTPGVCALIDMDSDWDGDGIPNNVDIDNDNDGLIDQIEGLSSTGLIPNGDFNGPDTPRRAYAPSPWRINVTPDYSTEDTIVFDGSQYARSRLTGFDPSPAGGSFMGFRSNEAMFNELTVMRADVPLNISFYYTEYAKPGSRYENTNVVFSLTRGSGSLQQIARIDSIRDSGGTQGAWEERSILFTPADFGISDGETVTFYLGAYNSASQTWGFVDGLVVDVYTVDIDQDEIPNGCDLDSDNDGISDLVESGASLALIMADLNRDGSISLEEAAAANGGVADADGDGLMDIFDADRGNGSPTASVGTLPLNSDSDDLDNFLDLDSDGDGIPDAVEAQPTTGFGAAYGNDGDVRDDDRDGDGVITVFDANDLDPGAFGGSFMLPQDTDLDGVPDYIDLDSDNDYKLDAEESGLVLSGVDNLADGIDDGVNPSPDYQDNNGIVNEPWVNLADEDNDPSSGDVDYREFNPEIDHGDAPPSYGDSSTGISESLPLWLGDPSAPPDGEEPFFTYRSYVSPQGTLVQLPGRAVGPTPATATNSSSVNAAPLFPSSNRQLGLGPINTEANLDDSTGRDDEEGVTFNLSESPADGVVYYADQTYPLDITVYNDTSDSAYLEGWLDFDGDGVFNTDERFVNQMVGRSPDAQTLTGLPLVIPFDAACGQSYARFRLADRVNLTSSGYAGWGETEDYPVYIDCRADLGIRATISPAPTAQLSEFVLIELFVINNGPNAAREMTVDFTFPAELTDVSAVSPDNWECNFDSATGSGQCTKFGLWVGLEDQVLQLSGRIPGTYGPDTVAGSATVSHAAPDPVPDNNSASYSTNVEKEWEGAPGTFDFFLHAEFDDSLDTSGVRMGDFTTDELILNHLQVRLDHAIGIETTTVPTLTTSYCAGSPGATGCSRDTDIINGIFAIRSYTNISLTQITLIDQIGTPYDKIGPNLITTTMPIELGGSGAERYATPRLLDCQAWHAALGGECVTIVETWMGFDPGDRTLFRWTAPELTSLAFQTKDGRDITCDPGVGDCYIFQNSRPGIYLLEGVLEYDIIFYDPVHNRLGGPLYRETRTEPYQFYFSLVAPFTEADR